MSESTFHKETCVFLDYFEDGGNKLFRNVGTYTPIYMASNFRKPKPHIDNILAKELEKS